MHANAKSPRLYFPILFQDFQHEAFQITPTLNAGSRCARHVSRGNAITVFNFFCAKRQKLRLTLLTI
jgi:hypothetical protein